MLKDCAICGTEFKARTDRFHECCSRACGDRYRTRNPPKRCAYCGKAFNAGGSSRKYCREECRRVGQREHSFLLKGVAARLAEGPATLEELARAVYGPEYRWPDSYQNLMRVTMHKLKKGGLSIDRLPAQYKLTNHSTLSAAIARAMRF